jgi:maltose alpha-D-glucosyltransferase / alpha-amylase
MRRVMAAPQPRLRGLTADPLWYRDAVIYELRVRSFMDSNGDGIGDFRGLTEKLDYLQDLGVSAVWLLPICPSPGKDDGYDISDYTDVHPDLGTLDDFKVFLDEAHRHGIRVITELVLNHTSDQHPWFQRARRAPAGSRERNFYVWSDTPDRYKDARIIFKDFEPSNWSWDPVATQYFWHRFFAHQPDLNFDNPEVHDAMLGVVDFWFNLGVDGLRLDAVPYLYERDGTNCENLPETHAFLKKLRAHVDARFKNRMLLAEANQWPEDAAQYFGKGDECHMNFHFPIMPRIFMSMHMEDRLPIIDILAQTPQLPPGAQWAIFLRNHDELTLEMVTDEERDYMYRAFAHDQAMRINLGIRRRLAPLVGNDRRSIQLMNGLLFSLPGTPVVYYGDEIGMGDNVFLGDRNGVRTPMQWSADRNAGFSRANPQRLILPVIIDPEYHYESLNVEAQQQNPNSLLWWTKRLVALRKRFQAFGRGSIEFLAPDNPHVLAFVRKYEDETALVVANLSRRVQYVELNLAEYKGRVPVELFGQTRFPAIGELPYLLTLGAHEFYWFSVQEQKAAADAAREAAYQPPVAEAPPRIEAAPSDRALLEQVLPGYMQGRRWFCGRDRDLSAVRVLDVLAVGSVHFAVVRAEFTLGEPEDYVVPLSVETGDRAAVLRERSPQAIIAHLRAPGRTDEPTSVLLDPTTDAPSSAALLDALRAGARGKGNLGPVWAWARQEIAGGPLEPRLVRGDHRRVAVSYGEQALLKLYRRLGEGTSPELEVNRWLGEHAADVSVPPLLGSIEYRPGRSEPITLATLHGWVRNEGSAWDWARDELRRFYERALASGRDVHLPPRPAGATLLDLAGMEPPPIGRELFVSSLAGARLLGRRTAEMHLALANATEEGFGTEPYSSLDQRSNYQSKRNLTGKVLRQLRLRGPGLSGKVAELAYHLVAREAVLYKRFEPLLERRLTARRCRIHGHYHLGKLLYTGKDFTVVDFEGDSTRPLPERRRKRTALRDVVAMARSFEYAAQTALRDAAIVRESDRTVAEPWARLWMTWTPAAFLAAYLEGTQDSPIVPRERAETELLLDTLYLELALDDVSVELDRRPDWAMIALRSLEDALG